MSTDPTAKATLDAAIAAWNAGDLPGYLSMYADSARLHGYAPEAMDKAAATAFYEGFFLAFPDARITVEDELWDGGRVAVRATLTGTHEGDFNGIPPTGRRVALPTITILQFAGASLVER